MVVVGRGQNTPEQKSYLRQDLKEMRKLTKDDEHA